VSLTRRAIATTTADARYCLASRQLPVEAEVGSEHVEGVCRKSGNDVAGAAALVVLDDDYSSIVRVVG
jgi:hypothetical protein